MAITCYVDCGTLDAVVPVLTCALRHLKRHTSMHGGPVYPDCARCHSGAVFVAELERIGWQRPERIALSPQLMSAAYKARVKWRREHVVLAEAA
jgi:hypothetical protein